MFLPNFTKEVFFKTLTGDRNQICNLLHARLHCAFELPCKSQSLQGIEKNINEELDILQIMKIGPRSFSVCDTNSCYFLQKHFLQLL